jgi:hypothetical protein
LCALDENRFTTDVTALLPAAGSVGNGSFTASMTTSRPGCGDRPRPDGTLYRGPGSVSTRVLEEVHWADANANGRRDSDENLIEVSLNYFA